MKQIKKQNEKCKCGSYLKHYKDYDKVGLFSFKKKDTAYCDNCGREYLLVTYKKKFNLGYFLLAMLICGLLIYCAISFISFILMFFGGK